MKQSPHQHLLSTLHALGVAVGALLIGPLGCGVPAQATNPEDYSEFLRLSYQQTCEARHRCCGTLCSPQLDTAFYKNVSRTLTYLASGLIAFDKQAAADCLSSQSARFRACDEDVLTLPLNRCDKVLIPLSAAGTACEMGVNSCVPDTVCSGNKCVPRGKLGETCQPFNTTIGCATGLFCAQATGTTPAQCTAYSPLGKSCVSPARCDPTSNLVCLPSQLCGVPLPNASACTVDSQCASTYCDLSASKCAPPPVVLTVRAQLCAQPEPTIPQ